MIETAKTTSMVFIILLGATMLTAAFRGFGGEEYVRDFLAGIAGWFLVTIYCGDGSYLYSWVLP